MCLDPTYAGLFQCSRQCTTAGLLRPNLNFDAQMRNLCVILTHTYFQSHIDSRFSESTKPDRQGWNAKLCFPIPCLRLCLCLSVCLSVFFFSLSLLNNYLWLLYSQDKKKKKKMARTRCTLFGDKDDALTAATTLF